MDERTVGPVMDQKKGKRKLEYMYKIRVAIARLHRLICTIYLTRLLNNHQDRV